MFLVLIPGFSCICGTYVSVGFVGGFMFSSSVYIMATLRSLVPCVSSSGFDLVISTGVIIVIFFT